MSLVWQRRGGGRVLRPQGALHRGLSLALAPTGSPRAEGEELVLSHYGSVILFHVSRSLRLTCSPVCDKPLTPNTHIHTQTHRDTRRSLVSQTHLPQTHISISILQRMADSHVQIHKHTLTLKDTPRSRSTVSKAQCSPTHTKATQTEIQTGGPGGCSRSRGMLAALLRHAQIKDARCPTGTDTRRHTQPQTQSCGQA